MVLVKQVWALKQELKKCFEIMEIRRNFSIALQELHECYLASKPLAYAAGMTVPTSGRDNWSHYVLKETFGKKMIRSDKPTEVKVYLLFMTR